MSFQFRADLQQYELKVPAVNTANVNISSLTPTYPVFADSNNNLVTFAPVPVPSTTAAASISSSGVNQTYGQGQNGVIFGPALDVASHGCSFNNMTNNFSFPNCPSGATFLVTCSVQVLVNAGATNGSFSINFNNNFNGKMMATTPLMPASGYYELSFTCIQTWGGPTAFFQVYFINATGVNCNVEFPSISFVRLS